MTVDDLPEGLLNRISQAADIVKGCSQFRVISHYDADGISSAGIVSSVLLREGKSFQVTMAKSLEREMVSRLGGEGHECIVFSDMGSGLLTELERLDAKVVVLDHHRPSEDSNGVVHINPHLWDIDGMTGASASAVCMLLAVTVNPENWHLLPLAFAGVAGDRQDIKDLSGLNAWLMEEGVSRNMAEVRGRSLVPSGPLSVMTKRFDPYIKGVSGCPEGTASLLEGMGLVPKERGDDLDDAGRRKLQSLLVLRLLEQGIEPATLDELSGKRYFFPAWDMDSGEMASLLDACGRMGEEGTGLSLTLGDKMALKRARELRNDYIDDVLEALDGVEDGIQVMENIQHFRNEKTNLSGVVCGITMQYLADRTRPTLVLAEKGGKIRVSSRATFGILKMGVDLSEALKVGAEKVGGHGGGHAIASGATLPLGREREFLETVDYVVGEQKKGKERQIISR